MSDIPYGVHFSMDEDTYRAIPALNASGMKWLRVSPLDYWTRSVHNPNLADVVAEEGSTEAKDLGRAFDTRIISGKAAFDAKYAEELDPKDFPDLLRTQDDLKAELKSRDLAVSGSKDAQTQRLLEADPSLRSRIWDCLLEDHAMVNAGKEFITPRWMGKIATAAKMIECDPYLSKAFTGGAPQVSIVWHCPIVGVDCKARLDYLKGKAVVDLKTLTNTTGRPLHEAVNREIAARRYHVQAAFYLEGVSYAAKFLKEGLTDAAGPAYDPLVKALMANHPKTWLWVFQIKGVAPSAIGRTLPPYDSRITEGGDVIIENSPSVIVNAAKAEIDQHKMTYRAYLEKYGNLPWVTPTKIEMLADEDLPPWSYQ